MTVSDARDFSRTGVSTANVIGVLNGYSGGIASTGFMVVDQLDFVMLTLTNTDPTSYFSIDPGYTYSGGGTPSSGTSPIVFGPSQVGQVLFPVLAPLMDIQSTLLTGTIVSGANGNPIGITGHPTLYDVRAKKTALVRDSSAYIANQAKTFAMGYWYEGHVLVTCTSNQSGLSAVDMQYYDASALAFKTFATLPVLVNTTGAPIRMNFPPAPVQAVVMNAGTAQTIEFYVEPAPGG